MKETCSNCNAEFEFDPNDLIGENEDNGNGEAFRFYSIECPKCSYYVEVEPIKGVLLSW